MKRIYLFITTILLLLPISISAKEKVDLYLFHSETCSHCQAEIKFLEELEKEYDNLEVHLYETNNSKKNTELMIKIKEKLPDRHIGIATLKNKTPNFSSKKFIEIIQKNN